MKKLLLAFGLVVLTGCTPAVEKNIEPESSTEKTVESSLQTPNSQRPTTVKIIEFFDYACPHCRDAHFTVKNLEKKFGDKVEFETKHFPLSPETFLVAETAECARRQGEDKFKAYHNELLENNFRQYAPENLQFVAEKALLNMEAFNTCVANGGGKSEVQADVDEATAMGVRGTPYFIINDNTPLPGAIPEKSFARLIQQVLDGESL